MKNRAYVFQVTTPGCTVCLSAEEQRGMDVFVFFLQIQSRLKDQIRGNTWQSHYCPWFNSEPKGEIIRIYRECEGGIEKSILRIFDWHHKGRIFSIQPSHK